MRRASAVVAALALLAPACAARDALTLPHCSEEGPVLIMAQAVPSASQIPCLDGLPDGWSLSRADISQAGSIFRFDSDRAGENAATLSVQDRCDISEAVSVRADTPDIEQFEHIIALDPSFRAERSYVFDGGCVQWRFDFDRGVSATLTVGLDERLLFLSRAEYEEILDESFMDVDL